jgi:4,5-dihydroxyphthalate decarboxylase
MEALSTGIISPEGVDLRYIPIQSSPEIFARMAKTHSFDVAEMSLAHYFIMRARGEFPFVAIPVFPSRVFRHGYIFVNAASGIRSPNDLEGKKVGVQEYRQTAGVWVRGMLQHDHGVNLGSIEWVEGGVNEGRPPDSEMDLRPTGPLNLRLIEPTETLNDLLRSGALDAYFGARRPSCFGKGTEVKRLFDNFRAEEKAYYKRTGFHPIMHTLVIREELHQRHPWVAESLFKACQQSKGWALKQLAYSGAQKTMLPWLYEELDEMFALMGSDPWPYGLSANQAILDAFMHYLVEQHFIAEPVPIHELFAPIVGWTE